MAITAITPATLATIVSGDSVAFTIDDTYTSLVIKVQTATALVNAYSTALGGGQSGYSVAVVDNGDGTHTVTTTADSGWDVSPQLIYVVEDETGTEATTSLSYTITGEAAFPQGKFPYNPTTTQAVPDVVGPNSVTDHAVVLFDGTTGKLIKEVAALGASGTVLTSTGLTTPPTFQSAGAGSGDVVGPAGTTVDGEIAIYDDTTGKLIRKPNVAVTEAAVIANTAKVTNAAHTGDVTGSGALTIADEAVTLAKMAHLATARWLGRTTAATGDVEALTKAQVLTGLNVADGADVSPVASVHGRTGTVVSVAGDYDETEVSLTGDTSLQSDLNKGWDGTLLEPAAITITESVGTVSLNIERSGGGDLDLRLGGETFFYDTSPADSIALSAGTDISPTLNYVWLIETAGTVSLATSTTGWPASAEYCAVATVLVQSAADVALSGPYKVHAWTDHVSGSQRGHVHHLSQWIRTQPATWASGVNANALSVSAPNAYLSTDLGVVLQLHEHDYPAFDMSTGDPLYVVNSSVSAYEKITTLDTIDADSTGTSINNKWVSLVIWGSVNEASGDCKLFCNLPAGSYSTQASAEEDASGYANFTIPSAFTGTGFLIATYVVKAFTSGTWVHGSIADLRGLFPSTSPSAGAGGGVTDHGALTGLADDDHTQYSLVDGTRAFTGAIEVDSATAGLTVGEHSSSMGTPAAGKVNVYAKADGLLYSKDDAGTETLVSSGSEKFYFSCVSTTPSGATAATWYGPDDRSLHGDTLWSDPYGTGTDPVITTSRMGIVVPFTGTLDAVDFWCRTGSSSNNGLWQLYKWTRVHQDATAPTVTAIGSAFTVPANTGSQDLSQASIGAAVTKGDTILLFYQADATTPNTTGLLAEWTLTLLAT